ncbi:iron ABC transporter substrate-binding protein [Herpetosiphon llansteffanensis]|uniref:iron ABC transporter substrate-binding protein n=1 Tax=Herpetosiphon llansteffanensis TaxID=2094568 RepID=UPI000D7D01E2|nr:iron ABC transporter substrate-binding protein [Herpetosiphon llansteffanensis]
MKLVRSLMLLLCLSMVIAACGGAATPTTAPAAPTTAAATPTTASAAEATATVEVTAVAEVSPTVPTTTTTEPAGGSLVVYSGRSESLVAPLLELFTQETGIAVEVRYGDTAEMAAQILEEGENSPADVFFGQDAGALGALSDRFVQLDSSLLSLVDPRFASSGGKWVGASGRARVLVYNTDVLTSTDLPASILDLTKPEWKGRLAWAPTNGSLQAFVTALRVSQGEDVAKQWLEGLIANEIKVYESNSAIVKAVANGEVDAGLVNHYYLFALKKDQPDAKAANHYFSNGDIGSLVNVAGVGILQTAKNPAAAQAFASFLLSETAQNYFTEKTNEYPLVAGITTNPAIKPLSEITTPDIDLSNLKDLQGTLELLQDVGAIQ